MLQNLGVLIHSPFLPLMVFVSLKKLRAWFEDSSVYWVTIPESVGTQEVFLSFFRNNMFQLSGISGRN